MIRRAKIEDISRLLDMLSQVLEIHAEIRPDIFNSGATKYSEEELEKMIEDDDNPIFVITDDNDYVTGYAFCEVHTPHFKMTMKPNKILFIDDFCIDEKYRHQHYGKTLFDFLKKLAKDTGCYEIALYAWAGNENAQKFYEKMGLKVKSQILEYIV